MNETTLTQERLKEVLDYDPETGIFTWKVQRQRIRIGTEAGCNKRDSRNDYRYIMIDGKRYLAHRLAYLFVVGATPPQELDVSHDDQNGLNNRWANLNLMSNQENHKNLRRPKNNTSGVTGVTWHKQKQKWCAGIMIQGKQIHIGYFTDKRDAIVARKSAEIRYGFHRLHGSG